MFFSIVVPTYNRSKLLCRCLDSIKNQTFGDYEVLILDDCSSDDTSEVVKKYTSDERFEYIRFEKNQGFGDKTIKWAQDKGLFKGEWFIEICDDDILSGDKVLEKIFYKVKNDSGVKCAVVDLAYNYGGIDIFYKYDNENISDVLVYDELSKDIKNKIDNTFAIAWKMKFFMEYDYCNSEKYNCRDVYTELSYPKIYKEAQKILYLKDEYYMFSATPNARRKYLDYYNWIVSSGLLCADIQDKEGMYQRLKRSYTEPGLMLGAFFDWGAEELARALSTFAGNEVFPKILRQFARIYQEQYNEKLMSYYVDFNNSLMSEGERNEAISRAKNIVVYCENSWTSQICDYLKNKGKNILYIADDEKEGYKNYQDILKEKDLIDLVFIASGAPKVIYQILQKLKPRENNIKVATLIMKDTYETN